jgi:hypothetical protein
VRLVIVASPAPSLALAATGGVDRSQRSVPASAVGVSRNRNTVGPAATVRTLARLARNPAMSTRPTPLSARLTARSQTNLGPDRGRQVVPAAAPGSSG